MKLLKGHQRCSDEFRRKRRKEEEEKGISVSDFDRQKKFERRTRRRKKMKKRKKNVADLKPRLLPLPPLSLSHYFCRQTLRLLI